MNEDGTPDDNQDQFLQDPAINQYLSKITELQKLIDTEETKLRNYMQQHKNKILY